MSKRSQLFKHAFKEGAGASVLNELRTRFLDQASYTKGDPMHMAYLEGQREVIRYIIRTMEQPQDDE